MCEIKDCERHEFDKGLCLTHLKESTAPVDVEVPKKTRKKKIEAVDVLTMDATEEMETRETSE